MLAKITRLMVLISALGMFAGPFAGLAWAEDKSPEAFYGKYSGTGISQNPVGGDFGFDNRDMDVEIGAEGNGFFVAWTTVIDDFKADEPRRRESRLSFVPSARASVFVDAAAAVQGGERLAWASIKESTLTVSVLTILGGGGYAVQTYHRTLTDVGMSLYFFSDRDGQTRRVVTAFLTKQ